LIARETRKAAPRCPAFVSKDSVLNRPDGDPAKPTTVVPGAYEFSGSVLQAPVSTETLRTANREPRPFDKLRVVPSEVEGRTADQIPAGYSVVWWDPHVLALQRDAGYGLRRDDLIVKDGDPDKVATRLSEYDAWRVERDQVIARARVQSRRIRTATAVALDKSFDQRTGEPEIEVLDLARSADRPFGPRFGSLVHATLATVPLDAGERVIASVAQVQGRILPKAGKDPYADEEVSAAVEVVTSVLGSPLFDRVRNADRAGKCERELPIVWKAPDGSLIEGTIDLAFDDGADLIVVDFKTDRELAADLERYKRQLGVYCQALGTIRKRRTVGILARV
jgi:hypothetical protein